MLMLGRGRTCSVGLGTNAAFVFSTTRGTSVAPRRRRSSLPVPARSSPFDSATNTNVRSRNMMANSSGRMAMTETGLGTAEKDDIEAYTDTTSFYPSDEEDPSDIFSQPQDLFPTAFFDEMDELEDALYEVSESLAEAVAREAYEEASMLKARFETLEGKDTTLEVARAFQAAIEEERYEDAAILRDRGGVRMLGWWVGREGAEDMAGHLVEVRRGVGRYVGRAWVGGGGGEGGGVEESARGDGGMEDSELFEVFYKKGADNTYVSQATVFDGRVVFVEDDLDGPEDDEHDGIRTVEDLLNMADNDDEAEAGEAEEAEEAEEEVDLDVIRQAAEIEWLDKDRFVLRIDAGEEGVDSGELKELERMVMAGHAGPSEAYETKARSRDGKMKIQINYRRLSEVEKDELYIGSFGPHGQEVVHIYTTSMDGKKMIEGRKITGDINVPAGEVSFRARIDSDNAFRGDDGKYPFEYGVVARYPGQGRVAREGFKDPKWVEGELLKFSSFSGGKFGNAEWGFVFEVGAEKRFLLLFERLKLVS